MPQEFTDETLVDQLDTETTLSLKNMDQGLKIRNRFIKLFVWLKSQISYFESMDSGKSARLKTLFSDSLVD